MAPRGVIAYRGARFTGLFRGLAPSFRAGRRATADVTDGDWMTESYQRRVQRPRRRLLRPVTRRLPPPRRRSLAVPRPGTAAQAQRLLHRGRAGKTVLRQLRHAAEDDLLEIGRHADAAQRRRRQRLAGVARDVI